MLVALLAASALAQSVTLDAGNALEAAPGTFYENGVGAPTVAWDPDQNLYLMFFETKLGNADATCPAGYWGIGVASSPDGYDWDVWPDPVVTPTAGTAWSCFAAQPAVVLDDGTYHLWFKAGQGTDACAVEDPGWGCAVEPGIGKVSGVIEIDDKADEIAFNEDELDRIDDELGQLLVDLKATVDDFIATLTASTALECIDYDDICSPCDELTLSAHHSGGSGPIVSTQVSLCQPFDFDVPPILPVTTGSAGKTGTFAYLRYGAGGTTSRCTYKGNSNAALSPYEQQVALGQCDTTPSDIDVIQLEVEKSGPQASGTTVEVTLTTITPQSWQGPGYDAILTLADLAGSLDVAGVEMQGPEVLDVIASLRAELSTFVPTAAVVDLDAAAADFEAALSQALADIDALQAERQAVEDLLDELYDYVPSGISMGRAQDGPALALARASYPSVVKVGGTWIMQVGHKRNLWEATSVDGESFTLGASAAILHNTVTWSQDELFTPALTCGPVGFERYESIYGGRDTSNNIPGGAIVEAGLGNSISPDRVTWFAAVMGWVTWQSSTEWRHFDVLQDGGEHRFWVSELDPNTGLSVIRTGSTGPVADVGGTGRVCD